MQIRLHHGALIGLHKPRARLTEGQAIHIFEYNRSEQAPSSAKLAAWYGVSEKAIRDIWTGRTWLSVTQPPAPDQPRGRRMVGRPKGRKDQRPRRKRVVVSSQFAGTATLLTRSETNMTPEDESSSFTHETEIITALLPMDHHEVFNCSSTSHTQTHIGIESASTCFNTDLPSFETSVDEQLHAMRRTFCISAQHPDPPRLDPGSMRTRQASSCIFNPSQCVN